MDAIFIGGNYVAIAKDFLPSGITGLTVAYSLFGEARVGMLLGGEGLELPSAKPPRGQAAVRRLDGRQIDTMAKVEAARSRLGKPTARLYVLTPNENGKRIVGMKLNGEIVERRYAIEAYPLYILRGTVPVEPSRIMLVKQLPESERQLLINATMATASAMTRITKAPSRTQGLMTFVIGLLAGLLIGFRTMMAL